ncbi:ATP-binding protein [Kitasatospora sp. HPMI-4]|uniref:ATP-binding protein n=1 Tax=Kitasatospora sp. HPMI-4 TaxID=3448443 RepID=UPI003F19D6D2
MAQSAAERPGGEPGQPVEGVWRFSAVAHEASVPQTRHAVRDRLLAQGLAAERYQELVDDVLLIVSELVGNAVTHAAVLSPYLTTELAIEDGWVRISVEDGHPHRPKALESDQGQLGGRGLLLVKSVTSQAGGVCDVECTGEGGKVVWAALPLPAGPVGRTGDGDDGEAGGGPGRTGPAHTPDPDALDGLSADGGLWPV